MNPTIGKIRRHNGVAGQIAYSVSVTYPGEDSSVVTFVGSSVYGGPVVMQTESNPRGVFVVDVERFGKFGPDWVRRFFSAEITKNDYKLDDAHFWSPPTLDEV